jgi:uncharacterized protein
MYTSANPQANLHANPSDSLEARWQRAQRLTPGQAPSPCVGVCTMSAVTPEQPLCGGCYRSLEEIAHWGSMNAEAKLALWQTLRQREAAQFN